MTEWSASPMDEFNITDIPPSSPLYGVEPETISELFFNIFPTIYKKGDFIFLMNMRPSGAFYLRKGKVKIVKRGTGYFNKIVRLAKEGSFLGYRSLLANEPYQASAETIEDSVVYYIPRERFFRCLEKSPTLALNMLRHLANDLKEAEASILQTLQKSAISRTAEAILHLFDVFGDMTTGKINVELKREEIAEIAGLSIETTIRSLGSLRKKNYIAIEGRTIQILDRKALERIAQSSDGKISE